MTKRLSKISKLFLAVVLITGWIFSGWPQIFKPSTLLRSGFPQGIQIAYATDTSPTIAGTGTNVDGAGTEPWATTDEITVAGGGDDGVYATQLAGELAKSEISDILTATNFGFSIPDGSTILGIKVEVDRREGNTQTNGGIIDNTVQLIDETGAIRTTVNKADTATFWPTTDGTVIYGGTSDTWGEAAGFWTTTKINDVDFGVAFVAENKKAGGGGAVESALVDFIRVTVTYGPASITVGTTGTQTATMSIPSTNQYVGGAFTFVRSGGTANVTSITISETDATLSAQSYLSNLDLYYETAGTCTYDGVETLFGTDTAFDASEDAVITGTMAVGTSQVCVYAVLDIVSGAPDADTFDLEITNPSTEVVVSAGDVTPATAVAISGATTLNLPVNVFQDHYRWRNDNGPQGNQAQTLYFNPTGNGFGTVDFTIVAATCASGSEWDCVDDDSTDTSSFAPSSDTETSELLLAAATDYYTLADNQLLAGSTITQLDITVAGADDVGNPNTSVALGYCIVGGANDCGTSDTMGAAQNITGADQTKTEPFTGLSLSTADLNNMQLVLTGSGVKAQISTLYVLVTYSVPEATWATGAEDQVLSTLDKNSNIRLRFQIDNTGGSANSYNYRLEWAARGIDDSCDTSYTNESYSAVPDTATTEHFDMTLSAAPGYVDGESTTAKLSNAESYTFVAGTTVESTSNQSGAVTLAQNQYTEVEYVFQANTNATDGGVYCFRVTNAGTVLDGADVIAQVTLAGGGGGPTLTFSITDNDIFFGTLSASAPRWADNTADGIGAEVPAHSMDASTNATNGYTITVSGTTLTSSGTPSDTISAIGASAVDVTTGGSIGTEQFGIRLTKSGTGTVSAPYNGAANNYALDTAAFPDVVATGAGDGTSTTFSVFYAANIATTTEAHTDYTSSLTYIATGNF